MIASISHGQSVIVHNLKLSSLDIFCPFVLSLSIATKTMMKVSVGTIFPESNHPLISDYPIIIWWLSHPSEKYERQLGRCNSQYMKDKNWCSKLWGLPTTTMKIDGGFHLWDPKWMVSNGNPKQKLMIWGYPYDSGNLHFHSPILSHAPGRLGGVLCVEVASVAARVNRGNLPPWEYHGIQWVNRYIARIDQYIPMMYLTDLVLAIYNSKRILVYTCIYNKVYTKWHFDMFWRITFHHARWFKLVRPRLLGFSGQQQVNIHHQK